MTTPGSEDPTQWKIFPRNLTARADYRVRGNPTNTRLESGVDNCYPGLEFDQRNLDKAFFPGLIFEFHRSDGAILHQIVPNGAPTQAGLTATDNNPPLYLWALVGRTLSSQSEADPPAFFLNGLDGLEVWRSVHNLLPGRVAIAIGPSPNSILTPSLGLIRQLDQIYDSGQGLVQRNPSGQLEVAILVGQRSRYLDENGVLDAAAYEAGDLTRSLCSPWQYDFRDCGCFYWAASKPDIVMSADGQQPYLNFQRKDRTTVPQPAEVLQQWDRDQEIDYADLIAGAWNQLPIVLNDRESEQFVPTAAVVPQLLTRQQVIDELRYLATVEHALCVEYLYAHYSLNAPSRLPETGVTDQIRQIFTAANEVFLIAVDEMRHLRWVNEALDLLQEPPLTGRAELVGRAFNRPFELKPLTSDQLQWFIDVEQPSQSIGQGLDGMYVRLLVSIDQQPDAFPERERMVHLMKLIIDEGEGHYQRFLSVQQQLAGMDSGTYLRSLVDPPAGSQLTSLQALSDENYAVLLGTLQVSLSLGDRAGGILLEQARRAMFNLHETSHYLASQGVRIRFTLPPAPVLPLSAETAHAHVDSLSASMNRATISVMGVGNESERAMAERQQHVNNELFERMHQLIREDLGQ
jgi:hypothetical protein